MQVRHPGVAIVGGGILAGLLLHLAMPVRPLPPPEPTWRKSGAAFVEQRVWAQTYPVTPGPSAATPAGPPPEASGAVIHWTSGDYAAATRRTRYDELPRYDDAAPAEQPAPEAAAAPPSEPSATPQADPEASEPPQP